jgi:DNA-binding transcriptional MerR regulator
MSIIKTFLESENGMEAKEKQLFIGQLAIEAGVSTDTIRYYERISLLPPPGRNNSGYRIYNLDSVTRLAFIQKAQVVGFSLEEIKDVLDLRKTGKLPCDSVIQMAESQLVDVEKKLSTLSTLRDRIKMNIRHWKRQHSTDACAAAQFCNLIEEIEIPTPTNGNRDQKSLF